MCVPETKKFLKNSKMIFLCGVNETVRCGDDVCCFLLVAWFQSQQQRSGEFVDTGGNKFVSYVTGI